MIHDIQSRWLRTHDQKESRRPGVEEKCMYILNVVEIAKIILKK